MDVILKLSLGPSINGDGVKAPILLMSESILIISGGSMYSISKFVSAPEFAKNKLFFKPLYF